MTNPTQTCSLCSPDVESIQEIFQNETMRVIYPRGPIIPQHLMIVPLRHVKELSGLSPDESRDLISAYGCMKKALYDTDRITGGNLFVNDGEEAGQHVPHVHFHMFGRSDHEPISPYKILNSLNEYSIEQLDDQEIRLRADKFGEAV